MDRLPADTAVCIRSITGNELCVLAGGSLHRVCIQFGVNIPSIRPAFATWTRVEFRMSDPSDLCTSIMGSMTCCDSLRNACRYAIPYATFVDIRRKDYWATMSHHWVTFSLITFSYGMGLTKAGLVIMLLHDVSDPFLELAKVGNYATPPRKAFTNTLFVVFTALWISMRVVYFPGWVLYSVLFHAVDGVAGDADPSGVIWVWYFLTGLLIALFLLHLFWTFTIIKIALIAVASGGRAEDSREDDDGDAAEVDR
jgi:hypothetical protein